MMLTPTDRSADDRHAVRSYAGRLPQETGTCSYAAASSAACGPTPTAPPRAADEPLRRRRGRRSRAQRRAG